MIQFFCIVCMAPHLRMQSLFCSYCMRKIFAKPVKLKERCHQGVKHFYLFDWNSESDLASRSVIYFLKNRPASFFEEFLNYVYCFDVSNELISAVVPSCSQEKVVNHAESLAKAMKKQKMISCVYTAKMRKKVGVVEQKRKSKVERLKSNTFDVTGFKCLKSWIFVDDVLVSGGTFKSISEVMFTNPKAIFTLFYRPQLKNRGFYDA